MILTPLQKLPNNVGNLSKIIGATGFECLPKKQKSVKNDFILISLNLVFRFLNLPFPASFSFFVVSTVG